jgi:hypothetical protein
MIFKDLGDFITTIAYDSDNKIEFIGTAEPGSSKGDAVWKISKMTYDGDNLIDIQFADGDLAYDNIWDNRESLSYS